MRTKLTLSLANPAVLAILAVGLVGQDRCTQEVEGGRLLGGGPSALLNGSVLIESIDPTTGETAVFSSEVSGTTNAMAVDRANGLVYVFDTLTCEENGCLSRVVTLDSKTGKLVRQVDLSTSSTMYLNLGAWEFRVDASGRLVVPWFEGSSWGCSIGLAGIDPMTGAVLLGDSYQPVPGADECYAYVTAESPTESMYYIQFAAWDPEEYTYDRSLLSFDTENLALARSVPLAEELIALQSTPAGALYGLTPSGLGYVDPVSGGVSFYAPHPGTIGGGPTAYDPDTDTWYFEEILDEVLLVGVEAATGRLVSSTSLETWDWCLLWL